MTSPKRVEFFARAAMLGLMAAAHTGCGGADAENEEDSTTSGGTDGSHGGKDAGTGSSGGTVGSGGAGAGTGGKSAGTGGKDGGKGTGGKSAGTGGTGEESELGGAGGEDPTETETDPETETGILSSEVIPDVTLESFTEDCDEVEGVIETHASCNGANSCSGFSYDTDTHVYTVHTCKGYNTCRGFTCVVPE